MWLPLRSANSGDMPKTIDVAGGSDEIDRRPSVHLPKVLGFGARTCAASSSDHPRLWGAPAPRMAATSLGRAREVLRIFSGMRSADFFRKFFAGFFRRFLRRNFERGNLLCRMPVRADRSRKGFRMPARRERSTQVRGRASERPRRTNPRDSGERLAYGDFAWQRLWRGMVFPRSARGESR